MPLNPGDVKLIPPIQQTYGNVNGQAVPVIRAYFSVRGQGSYDVMVPRDGWTPQVLEETIAREAAKIVAILDAIG